MNQTKQSRQIVKMIEQFNGTETPKSVKRLFEMNGGIKGEFDFLIDNADRFDFLDYVGGLDKIEEYLTTRRRQMIDDIVIFLENCEIFEHKDTGETVRLDEVLEYILDFDHGLKEFKSKLKKSTAADLIQYRNTIFRSNQFTLKTS